MLKVVDASGNVVWTDCLEPRRGEVYASEVGLPTGEYRVEVTTTWGARVEQSFRVESVGDEPKRIEIPIK